MTSSQPTLQADALDEVHAFWLAGMSCDGCSISAIGATSPTAESLMLGNIPGVPKVVLHHPVLAVDAGVIVKAGTAVLVSVRNAIGGADLGKLHESVEKDFKSLDESEKNIRSVSAKLESSFIYTLQKFHKE